MGFLKILQLIYIANIDHKQRLNLNMKCINEIDDFI